MVAIALALSSSVCWGVSDFIGGIQARRDSVLRVMLISQGIGVVFLAVLLAVRASGPPHLVKLLPAAAAGLGGVIALSAFYRALAIGTMSIVAPISATGVAIPVVVGIASGDRPAALQMCGIAACVVGVVLASRERSEASTAHVARAAVLLSLVAAAGFGGYFVGMRSAAQADVPWALFVARTTGVIAIALAVGVRREAIGWRSEGLLALVTIGLLDLSANGLYAVASRHGALSEVAVAAALYPVATVLLARAVLGERVRRVQEVGIVAALAGVVLVAAG
jgi:drug/metabolite transporter (DMT)-like permease